jgi:hypothetical protein
MRRTKNPERASPENAKLKVDDTGIALPRKAWPRIRRPLATRKARAPASEKRYVKFRAFESGSCDANAPTRKQRMPIDKILATSMFKNQYAPDKADAM